MSQVIKTRLYGLIFLLVIAAGLYLVAAIFNEQFKSFEYVTLKTDNAGLNLPEKADVKIRGELIGEVKDQQSSGHGAILQLAIESDKIEGVPRNVTATLLPKTLFGEKYVSLNYPSQPQAQLADGDTITQVKLPTEVEQVLDNIYPLLRTVQPAQLSYTLNALATALDGRGPAIGHNIVVLGRYLQRFNPQVPALMQDLRLLSTVSDTYADVMPQVAQILRNTVKTTGTLEEKHDTLNAFLKDTAAFSDTARVFLDANGQNIVRVGQLAAPQLRLLARYSPEFPCLLKGLVNAAPRQAETFRGFIFHIDLIMLKKQPRGYTPADMPVYGANNPPHCGTLPTPPFSGHNIDHNTPDFNDGVSGQLKRTAPSYAPIAGNPAYAPSPVTGTQQEKDVIVPLTAPLMGRPADRVGDVTTLLVGPLARGAEVSVR